MIRILIANSNPATREQLRAHIAHDTSLEIVGMARDGQEAVQIAHQSQPDIALLAVDLAVSDGYRTAEFLCAAKDLSTECILMGDVEGDGDMRRAMRAGAREALFGPLNRTTLLELIHEIYIDQERRRTPAFARAADPNFQARVIPITGAKGGVGKTTVAVNLAVAILRETNEPTVLIDLYAQYGDVAMLLNLLPRRTLSELADLDSSHIDEQLLEDSMESHYSGLRVLFTAKTPVALDAINVPLIENVIGLLKRNYRYIVIDVPPILHPTTLYALSHATTALIVANLHDLTTLNDTRQLLQTLTAKYLAREKIKVVLNRMVKNNRIQLADIEKTMGHPADVLIPNDGRVVPEAINTGNPFVITHANAPVSLSIRKFARELAGLTQVGSNSDNQSTDDGHNRRGLLSNPLFARDNG